MNFSPLHYIHALNTVPSIRTALPALLEYFDTPESIWTASDSHLKASGLGAKGRELFLAKRNSLSLEDEWHKLTLAHITLITQEDARYPKLLKEIHQPPVSLYARGECDMNRPVVAIVGSRHNSEYGTRVTERFVSELVASGITVASGLAFGIDSIAHTATLREHGTTIAVLGNSLDDASISPKSHLPLAHDIIRSDGLLLSEYPPATSATPYSFPARNRILSGISLGTIVIEAAAKSGSLITARFSLEQNREVFAVPGSIFSEGSLGPHQLIRSGAKIATSIQDILEELTPHTHRSVQSISPPDNLSPEETLLYNLLSPEPLHIDKILKATTLKATQIQSSLVILEIKGLIKNIGRMHFIKL
jgi:DNA processing protein